MQRSGSSPAASRIAVGVVEPLAQVDRVVVRRSGRAGPRRSRWRGSPRSWPATYCSIAPMKLPRCLRPVGWMPEKMTAHPTGAGYPPSRWRAVPIAGRPEVCDAAPEGPAPPALHLAHSALLGRCGSACWSRCGRPGLGMLITLLGLPRHLAHARRGPRHRGARGGARARPARRRRGGAAAHPGWSCARGPNDPAHLAAQLYLLAALRPRRAVRLRAGRRLGGRLGLLAAPAWYWALPDGIELGIYDVDTLWKAVLTMPLGAALAAVAVVLTVLSGRAWKPIAERLLAARAPKPHPGAVAGTGGEARRCHRSCRRCAGPHRRRRARAAVPVLGRSPAGPRPGPRGRRIGLLVPVGVQAAFAARDHAPAPRLRGLTADAGLALVAMVVCLGAWVISGAGSFWPGWVLLGLAIAARRARHRRFGARSERRALAPRWSSSRKTRAERRRTPRRTSCGASSATSTTARRRGWSPSR